MRKRQRGGSDAADVSIDLLKVIVRLADAQGITQKMMMASNQSSAVKSMGTLFEAVQNMDIAQYADVKRRMQQIITSPPNSLQKALSSWGPTAEEQRNLDVASKNFIKSLEILNPYVDLLERHPNLNVVDLANANDDAILNAKQVTFKKDLEGLKELDDDTFSLIKEKYEQFKTLWHADTRDILYEPKFKKYRAAIALFSYLYKKKPGTYKKFKNIGALDSDIVNFAGYGKIFSDVAHGAFKTLMVVPLAFVTPLIAIKTGASSAAKAVKSALASRTQVGQASATFKQPSQ